LYHGVEVAAAGGAIYSLEQFRPGQSLVEGGPKAVMQICIAVDAVGGVTGLIVHTGKITKSFKEEEYPYTLGLICIVTFACNLGLAMLEGFYLFSSQVPSAETSPLSIDMIMCIIECILVMLDRIAIERK
jgi:hypothetical protein